jgi:GT2 family glycosyltransferase
MTSNTALSLAGSDSYALDRAAPSGSAPIYLVTVLYNSRDCIASFAGSLVGQDFRDWRLVAIDNASSDGCSDILSNAMDGRTSILRNSTNVGFARAANQGMRAAFAQGAEFVILINNDIVMPATFLARFLALRRELQADVITPRIMNLDRPDEAWYAGGHLEYGWLFLNIHEPYDREDTRSTRTVDFASGCCLGISRAAVLQVGLFDESFFVYWEDTDFCIRLKQSGIKICYVNDAVIYHEGSHSTGGEHSVTYNRLYYRSYAQILRKHFGIAVAIRMTVRLSLKELGRPDKKWRRLLAMLAAMAKGLVAPLLQPPELDAAEGSHHGTPRADTNGRKD